VKIPDLKGESNHKGWLLSVFFAQDQIIRRVAKMQQRIGGEFFLEAKTLASTRFLQIFGSSQMFGIGSAFYRGITHPTESRPHEPEQRRNKRALAERLDGPDSGD
jgi:hypothetical protein